MRRKEFIPFLLRAISHLPCKRLAFGRPLSYRSSRWWHIAIRKFSSAQREPAYLKAATISLQTAFALERLLLLM
jgi:hypothetical protein